MSTQSAAPPKARLVYTLLLAIGLVSAIIGAVVVTVISYNYVTRPELRDPVPVHNDHAKSHASLGASITRL